jgi:hypothetical protein
MLLFGKEDDDTANGIPLELNTQINFTDYGIKSITWKHTIDQDPMKFLNEILMFNCPEIINVDCQYNYTSADYLANVKDKPWYRHDVGANIPAGTTCI